MNNEIKQQNNKNEINNQMHNKITDMICYQMGIKYLFLIELICFCNLRGKI